MTGEKGSKSVKGSSIGITFVEVEELIIHQVKETGNGSKPNGDVGMSMTAMVLAIEDTGNMKNKRYWDGKCQGAFKGIT